MASPNASPRPPSAHRFSAGDRPESHNLHPITARSSVSSITTPPPPYSRSNSVARQRINAYFEMNDEKSDQIIPRPKVYHIVNNTGDEMISPVTPKQYEWPPTNAASSAIRRKPVGSHLSAPPESADRPTKSGEQHLKLEPIRPPYPMDDIVEEVPSRREKGKRPSISVDTYKEVFVEPALSRSQSSQPDYAMPIPAVERENESSEPMSYLHMIRQRNQNRARRKTNASAGC